MSSPEPTCGQGLLALYALQTAMRHAATPGSIANHRDGYLAGIRRENRSNSFRLFVHGVFIGCLGCGKRIPSDSQGDHLLPLAAGGPEGAQNYVPLCGRCNSSKCARDFLEWWGSHGRSATELTADVLTAYARLWFQKRERDGTLEHPAPPALRNAVRELLDALPTDDHRRAVWRTVASIGRDDA